MVEAKVNLNFVILELPIAAYMGIVDIRKCIDHQWETVYKNNQMVMSRSSQHCQSYVCGGLIAQSIGILNILTNKWNIYVKNPW